MSCETKCAKTINITVFGCVVLLTIPEGNYFDDMQVNICTCQDIPENANETMTVNVQIGNSGPQFPLESCGHLVYGDQLRSRRCYSTRVAADTGTFTVIGGGPMCDTAHVNPPVLVAPAQHAKPQALPEKTKA